MAENFFPRAEDFDEMGDHLEMIARLLSDKTELDINDWTSIQKAVRMGIAPDVIPVGTQLTVNHSVYGNIKLDVVAHDHYEAADSKGAHTMTLMCHDVITSISFDEKEAFYYAEEELPAGSYYFTDPKGSRYNYNFTLDQPLLKGGQLVFYGDVNYAMNKNKVLAYDYPLTQTVPRTYDITQGLSGKQLGVFDKTLNCIYTSFQGSNNYKESAVRQFLNSTSGVGKVWSPQNKYDFPPEWKDVLAGFANGFSEDFLSKVGRVVVPCYHKYSTGYAYNVIYDVVDKFYLPSQKELFGGNSADKSTQLPFFKNATNVDRIKYIGVNKSSYWLRSHNGTEPTWVDEVTTSGDYESVFRPMASETNGVVPMFNIV